MILSPLLAVLNMIACLVDQREYAGLFSV